MAKEKRPDLKSARQQLKTFEQALEIAKVKKRQVYVRAIQDLELDSRGMPIDEIDQLLKELINIAKWDKKEQIDTKFLDIKDSIGTIVDEISKRHYVLERDFKSDLQEADKAYEEVRQRYEKQLGYVKTLEEQIKPDITSQPAIEDAPPQIMAKPAGWWQRLFDWLFSSREPLSAKTVTPASVKVAPPAEGTTMPTQPPKQHPYSQLLGKEVESTVESEQEHSSTPRSKTANEAGIEMQPTRQPLSKEVLEELRSPKIAEDDKPKSQP